MHSAITSHRSATLRGDRQLSRRAALAHLGLGLAVGPGLAVRAPRAAARQGSPMADPEMLPPVLQAWLTVWNDDPGQADQLYTEDAVLEERGEGVTYQDRDEIRGRAEAVFGAFPEHDFTVRSAFGTGDWVAAELVFTGAYSGSYPGLPPGAGQPVELPNVLILELEDGQIRREAHYYDSYRLLNQLGLLPDLAPAAGTPAP